MKPGIIVRPFEFAVLAAVRTVPASTVDGARAACRFYIDYRMAIHSDFFFLSCALVLGLVSGMRSMMAPAVLSLALWRHPELAPPVLPAQWFTLPVVAGILALLALGELVGDKLPRTPNRTALGPFLGRVLTGGITGAAFVQLGHLNAWLGAACGVVGAAASTFGMFHARRFVGRVTGIRDPWIGAMEDVIAIALAVSVVASLVR